MKRQTIILIIGGAVLLVLMAFGIFAAIGSSAHKLTLNADQTISKVIINGTSMAFTQGMKVDYKEATTLQVEQDGYDAFSVTLDPAKDAISSYSIKLTKTSNAPVGSQNYDLLKAAQNYGDNLGLIANSQLNARVIETKKFANGYEYYKIAPLDTSQPGGTALVVIQAQNNSYRIVLGPGTNFEATDLIGLPTDLATYLKSIGVGGSE